MLYVHAHESCMHVARGEGSAFQYTFVLRYHVSYIIVGTFYESVCLGRHFFIYRRNWLLSAYAYNTRQQENMRLTKSIRLTGSMRLIKSTKTQ